MIVLCIFYFRTSHISKCLGLRELNFLIFFQSSYDQNWYFYEIDIFFLVDSDEFQPSM